MQRQSSIFCDLGEIYYHGDLGLTRDVSALAIEFWTVAAKLGSMGAHFKLARWYYLYLGEEDNARGAHHFQ